eukprot:scaffold1206_cov388-Prasinococcus_capsulatus_cf.AAC.41
MSRTNRGEARRELGAGRTASSSVPRLVVSFRPAVTAAPLAGTCSGVLVLSARSLVPSCRSKRRGLLLLLATYLVTPSTQARSGVPGELTPRTPPVRDASDDGGHDVTTCRNRRRAGGVNIELW